jgi:hypothetical protein
MNAQISTLQPLSPVLQSRPSAQPAIPARRHFVGGFPLQDARLTHFNRLMEKLHRAPLDCDQIATASRDMVRQPAHGRYLESIEQRLDLADTVGKMLADPAWSIASEAVVPAHLVLDYVRGRDHVIPDNVPLFGHLDDAILIDAAWPELADEVECYRDYCRLRVIEAELRGCGITEFAFSRDDWQRERQAEAKLIAHCRKSGASSYLPSSGPGFFRVR